MYHISYFVLIYFWSDFQLVTEDQWEKSPLTDSLSSCPSVIVCTLSRKSQIRTSKIEYSQKMSSHAQIWSQGQKKLRKVRADGGVLVVEDGGYCISLSLSLQSCNRLSIYFYFVLIPSPLFLWWIAFDSRLIEISSKIVLLITSSPSIILSLATADQDSFTSWDWSELNICWYCWQPEQI